MSSLHAAISNYVNNRHREIMDSNPINNQIFSSFAKNQTV